MSWKFGLDLKKIEIIMIMGMRNGNRRMDNKAVMTFRELENGESVDSGK